MAATQISAYSDSSPIPSYGARSPGRAAAGTPKLRDCCIGCASSKVRCPRERPACSRCVKRKMACEYLASKRAGRKHDASDTYAISYSSAGSSVDINLDDAGKLNAAFLAPNGTTTTTTATSSLDASFLQPPRRLPTDTSLESTVSAHAPQPPLGLLSPESHDTDNYWASLMPFLTAESPDADIDLNDAPYADRDHSDLFDFGGSSSDGILSSFTFSPGALLQDNLCGLSNSIDIAPSSRRLAHKPTTPISADGDHVMTGSHCSCLAKALDLMTQLFPHPSNFCTTSETSGGDDVVLLPTVPVVVERNRHTVEAVSAMLACPCSQDAHLLAIMAHIVFKVLGWYAVAARRTPPTPSVTLTTSPSSRDDGSASISSDSINHSGSRSSSTRRSSYLEQVSWQAERVGRYRLDDDDSGRMVAQLVLSELHRVQSLVRELVAKLNAQSGTGPPSGSAGNIAEQQPSSPFSGAILDLLGVDLRKRLKELSVEIVGSLRNV